MSLLEDRFLSQLPRSGAKGARFRQPAQKFRKGGHPREGSGGKAISHQEHGEEMGDLFSLVGQWQMVGHGGYLRAVEAYRDFCSCLRSQKVTGGATAVRDAWLVVRAVEAYRVFCSSSYSEK